MPSTLSKNRPDFVKIRLTEEGQKLAGAAPLRISNGRRSVFFVGDTPIEVERSYEWNGWLANHAHNGGVALFEIVPEPTTEPQD